MQPPVGYNNQRVIFMIYVILCAIFAYLIGSINTAIIISKRTLGTDIRSVGSGNAGATNMLRAAGKKAAAAVFLADFFKGLIAVTAARCLVYFSDAPYICVLTAGFFAQAGHCFPVFFRFKGGKGVATAAGAAAGIMPIVALILLAVFTVVAFLTKIASLSSGICAVIYPLLAYFLSQTNKKFNFLFAASSAVLIIIMHAQNFARLIDGDEKPISTK
ncbi:MAG: glycerol-3-phosphate 1-O-acyltransferase PlsY [Ruminococcaceae bacterium]|nr:glycerol-3-phosphate 1-O-acyltransferase PlsY [Oscillospiraceae bacterium]